VGVLGMDLEVEAICVMEGKPSVETWLSSFSEFLSYTQMTSSSNGIGQFASRNIVFRECVRSSSYSIVRLDRDEECTKFFSFISFL